MQQIRVNAGTALAPNISNTDIFDFALMGIGLGQGAQHGQQCRYFNYLIRCLDCRKYGGTRLGL